MLCAFIFCRYWISGEIGCNSRHERRHFDHNGYICLALFFHVRNYLKYSDCFLQDIVDVINCDMFSYVTLKMQFNTVCTSQGFIYRGGAGGKLPPLTHQLPPQEFQCLIHFSSI